MTQALYNKFDEQFDTNKLAEDVKSAADKNGEYEEVPFGNYEVKVEKLELGASKKNDPMVKIWFKILEGKYKNSMIFMNQVITQGFQIKIMNGFLNSLCPDLEVEFVKYSQYADLLLNIHELIDDSYEYALSYREGKNGFPTFTINEIFTIED